MLGRCSHCGNEAMRSERLPQKVVPIEQLERDWRDAAFLFLQVRFAFCLEFNEL
jgi:hypothetical protein